MNQYRSTSAMLAIICSSIFMVPANAITFLHEDFETGWGDWDYPETDSRQISIVEQDSALSGRHVMQTRVTLEQLERRRYIPASARYTIDGGTDSLFVRFYARLPKKGPNPHHWIRIGATDGKFDIRGKSNTLPAGDEAYWLAVDIDNQDRLFYYVYWHAMRSGRCDDGSTNDGCKGDQGTTYYYGNRFKPEHQTPVARDVWLCIELNVNNNRIGDTDGSLYLWVDEEPVISLSSGTPTGRWLRDRFYIDDCPFESCGPVQSFSGFEFRTDERVKLREVHLEAYYQKDTFERRKKNLEQRGFETQDEQVILYDDLVIADERIGCGSTDRR